MKYNVKMILKHAYRCTIEADSEDEAAAMALLRFDKEFGEGAADLLVAFPLVLPAEMRQKNPQNPANDRQITGK